MKNAIKAAVLISGLMILAGCAASKIYTWKDINREVQPAIPVPNGYLKAYTEMVEEYTEDSPDYYMHIPYTIFTTDGKELKRVENSWPGHDEGPELIALPPGKYVINPDVKFTKKEIVGVTIEKGKVTEVHFKGEKF